MSPQMDDPGVPPNTAPSGTTGIPGEVMDPTPIQAPMLLDDDEFAGGDSSDGTAEGRDSGESDARPIG